MEQIAVSVNDVSKKFRLFNSPQERFKEALHPFKKKYHKEFWALKNITFEIEKGRTVGIIGRNGSGKSTLLQIICSILQPSSGEVVANGRISALLELGAGFNPEFTGRQNVFMKGMLMGFSTQEMKERLPQIEAFADIGEFIDQPVKIYSSGMFVRLAFAVSINVDPDILIVDEALAVGDAKFQHKCYGKFLEFQRSGKTIIFVTHDASAVIKHCDTAILLEKGEIIEIGEPKVITNYYIDVLFTGKISNYQLSPVLVEEGHKGCNIIHYKNKYLGVSQSLGAIDLANMDSGSMEALIADKKIVVGISYDNAKQLVDQLHSGSDHPLQKRDKQGFDQEKTPLEAFLAELPITDNCPQRKSYNKNEYRQATNKAEILDYLVLGNDKSDPTSIYSGDTIDIYIKAKFHKNIESPLFGFSIKTIDGLLIYALNTVFIEEYIQSVKESDVIVSRFTVKMNLNAGDYFIDLGLDESVGTVGHRSPGKQYESLDRRCSVIHLFVKEKESFHGYVNLEAKFREIIRNGKSRS